MAIITPQLAWLAPSRRAAAGVLATAIMAPLQAHAEKVPQAGLAGGANDLDLNAVMKSAKTNAQMREENAKKALIQLKQEDDLKQFRDWFTVFAKEDTPGAERVELLGKMSGMVDKDRMLPLGITKQDVLKGVSAVKRVRC